MTKPDIRPIRKSRFAVGVVVLGAGASTRMGRPKLLLPWGDTSVIGQLVRQWKHVGARQIAVVCRANDAPFANELDRLGILVRNRIINPAPERGMFSSIICAANWDGWFPALTAWVIVLGDQPHLRAESLRTLMAFQREHPSSICQPFYGGHGRHPVVLPRAAWIELRKTMAPDLKEFLRVSTVPVIKCPIDDVGLPLDLDTPADYERALRISEDFK